MRYYSNTAQEMTLTSAASAADTVLALSSTSGLPPSFPFTLVLDPGEATEEVVTCTNLVGSSATVTRGSDGTSASSHLTGAKVRHMLSARDLAEPQAHMPAATGVHGVTGQVVGTSDAQTLTNKTISGSSNTITNVPKSAVASDTVYTTDAQTLTNKTLSGSSNTFSNIPKSALPADVLYSGSGTTLVCVAADRSATGVQATSGNGLSWVSGDMVSNASSMWAAANPSRFTAPSSGVYLIVASVNQSSSGNAKSSILFYKNGTLIRAVYGTTTDATFTTSPTNATFPISLTAGDYIEYKPSGYNSSIGTNLFSFTMLKIA